MNLSTKNVQSEGMAGLVALKAAANETKMDRRTARVIASCLEMLHQKEEEIEDQRKRLQDAAEIMEQMEREGQANGVMQEVKELEEMIDILEAENAELRKRCEENGDTDSLRAAVIAGNGVTEALASQLNKLRREYTILKTNTEAEMNKKNEALLAAETVASALRQELDIYQECQSPIAALGRFDDENGFSALAKIHPEEHLTLPLRLDLDNFSFASSRIQVPTPTSDNADTVSVGKRLPSSRTPSNVPHCFSASSSKLPKIIDHSRLSDDEDTFPAYTPSRFFIAR